MSKCRLQLVVLLSAIATPIGCGTPAPHPYDTSGFACTAPVLTDGAGGFSTVVTPGRCGTISGTATGITYTPATGLSTGDPASNTAEFTLGGPDTFRSTLTQEDFQQIVELLVGLWGCSEMHGISAPGAVSGSLYYFDTSTGTCRPTDPAEDNYVADSADILDGGLLPEPYGLSFEQSGVDELKQRSGQFWNPLGRLAAPSANLANPGLANPYLANCPNFQFLGDNVCSRPSGRQQCYLADVSNACQVHDMCYANATGCTYSGSIGLKVPQVGPCDAQFRVDIASLCFSKCTGLPVGQNPNWGYQLISYCSALCQACGEYYAFGTTVGGGGGINGCGKEKAHLFCKAVLSNPGSVPGPATANPLCQQTCRTKECDCNACKSLFPNDPAFSHADCSTCTGEYAPDTKGGTGKAIYQHACGGPEANLCGYREQIACGQDGRTRWKCENVRGTQFYRWVQLDGCTGDTPYCRYVQNRNLISSNKALSLYHVNGTCVDDCTATSGKVRAVSTSNCTQTDGYECSKGVNDSLWACELGNDHCYSWVRKQQCPCGTYCGSAEAGSPKQLVWGCFPNSKNCNQSIEKDVCVDPNNLKTCKVTHPYGKPDLSWGTWDTVPCGTGTHCDTSLDGTYSACFSDCGAKGDPCCVKGADACNKGLYCFNGSCRDCGADGFPCCQNVEPGVSSCNVNTTCVNGTCRSCGDPGQPCCGTSCALPPSYYGPTVQNSCVDGTCQLNCGKLHQTCCFEGTACQQTGTKCVEGICERCTDYPDTGTACVDNSGGTGTCAATLTYGQKDAYLSTAGRNNPLFPVHTSTKLDITCPGSSTGTSVEDDNHGTSFDAVDSSGKPILAIAGTLTTKIPESAVGLIAMKYASCECNNSFLSLDTLTQDGLAKIAGALSSYLSSNLDCGGQPNPFVADLMPPLTSQGARNFAQHVANNPCTFAGDAPAFWLNAFSAAVASLKGQYHVCNNDASLETTWFNTLQNWSAEGATGDPPDCNQYYGNCAPVKFYYTP